MGLSRSSDAALIWGFTFVSFTINKFIFTVYFLLTIFLSCYYLDEFCMVFLFAFCGGGPECFSFHREVSFSTSAALQDLLSLYIKYLTLTMYINLIPGRKMPIFEVPYI